MGMVVKMANKRYDVLFILIICILFSYASATNYKSLSIEELFERTEIAFQGKVTEVVVELRANSEGVEEPWTKVDFEIVTSLKGDLAETHSLYFYGGVSDSKTIVVEAMPTFRVEDEVLIFAYEAVYYSPLVGFAQGLFKLDEQAWQNEAGQYLSIEEEKLILADMASGDNQAVLAMLLEMFSTEDEGGSQ